ncbi:GTP-binding protein lepA [Deinococcus proteolyticus MRP]|uniref:Elongation factor 4 n=1 Tax=Deinococcus proteolyticus (strain ATCC 35074 / DSM 20540 / JCM 6276 / NBRC 101906 / NCIMB 13154 / VKM Ac-1939 / CCM 2703 / MRP) TaxID=693977 RepID=F0RJN4_DEIPM|nr:MULTISPECIES: translation elongation factor 4 [Deinococcus]ADY26604.1 GTP-binding protein lepA [Deinococcus proteolyticus MRP]MCY1702730.1 translation elongation factor 4 [Deinococcus sp. SL84]
MTRSPNIRNFSIIAHVDHGKSTLADRILEQLGAMGERDKRDQTLDTLELERERGITIKSTPIRLGYTRPNGESYIFNLIDTPGHVDFNYEVSRSLAACEGVLLLVDASQGVEAQTIVNAYLAIDNDLEIVPVVNKIDLPAADPEGAAQELEEVIGIPAEDAVFASGKTGAGVPDILEAIVENIPAPSGDPEAPLKALIFDSFYDAYQGVILFVRVLEGTLNPKDQIYLMNAGKSFDVDKVGTFSPGLVVGDTLPAGAVGWVAAGIKDIQDAQVGDTLTGKESRTAEPFPGFKPAQPVVFSGLYPTDTEDYRKLREALEKLKLNDAAFSFEPETSEALGFGFRCGFLGLLHAEIIQERLEREYDLDLIATAPAVVYRVTLTNGEVFETQNPAEFPTRDRIELVEEPYIKLSVMVPEEYVGPIMQLLQERRGAMQTMNYIGKRVELVYEVPFAEILYDFHDRLKSISRGYASMDYEQIGYREGDLRKVDILVNNEVIDALAVIVHETKTYSLGRKIVDKMAEVIPRQMFPVPVQATIGGKIIARATVKAYRKDVLAKCYGGDITRKKKLLEKQKKGRARMKQFGTVEVPQEAFLAVLANED